MEEKELQALVSLLDDEDTEVALHVEQKIMSLGSPIIPFLETEWERSFNPLIQKKLEEMIHTIQFDSLQIRLAEWKDKGAEDLLEGMWIIATYQYPDLDLEKLRRGVDDVFREVWLDFKPDLHPNDQIKIINSVLFSKLKFSANTKNFHAPGNSMLNIVLESRKGNPISLCIIYMLVAQKLELPIYGVNLPNLFILTYKLPDIQFYINAFNRGLIFTREDIDNYVHHLHLTPNDIFYQPCQNIDIVIRTLRNLEMAFEKLGDHAKSEEIKTLIQKMVEGTDNKYV